MLRIQNLTLRRTTNPTVLLDTLSLTIEAGQRWCILGQNGVGKSTLLHTLAGLLSSVSETLLLHAQPLSRYRPAALARLRAFCPQHHHDTFATRVVDMLALARTPDPREDDNTRIAHILHQFDLTALAERDVCQLSGGERQRVALAMAWLQDTPLLLLDEPFSFLDLRHQQHIGTLLRHTDKTIVMALHDINQASALCSHALLLFGSGRWAAGTCDDMLTTDNVSLLLDTPMQCLPHHGKAFFVAA